MDLQPTFAPPLLDHHHYCYTTVMTQYYDIQYKSSFCWIVFLEVTTPLYKPSRCRSLLGFGVQERRWISPTTIATFITRTSQAPWFVRSSWLKAVMPDEFGGSPKRLGHPLSAYLGIQLHSSSAVSFQFHVHLLASMTPYTTEPPSQAYSVGMPKTSVDAKQVSVG
jgi:hypothetical protein